jgi:hypothetical protein
VGRTLVTENGGATWSALANADVFYDLVVEQDPPVMITGAVPAQMPAGQTGDIVLQGFGFRTGAAVDFGADITVNSVLWLSAQQLQANVTITDTGASEPRSVDVTVTNPSIVFPNVARVFTVQPVADSDGDGTPNAADCAPLDGTVESPASEVAGLQVLQTAGPAQVSWTSQDGAAGSATDYDVVAGDLGALRASGTYAAALCAVDDHADTPFLDAAVVGSGEGRYWLVRACNGCNLSGCTFGDGSGVTDPRDALDVSSPCP